LFCHIESATNICRSKRYNLGGGVEISVNIKIIKLMKTDENSDEYRLKYTL